MSEGEGAGMDKGWSLTRAHQTPAALLGRVRVRARTVCAWEREEGHDSRVYSSSWASVIGVTLPEGPHGMVEEATRKRRCPAPTRALPGARARAVEQTSAMWDIAKPRAVLASPGPAWPSHSLLERTGSRVAPTLLQPQMLPSASFWEALCSPKHTACSTQAPRSA